MNAVEFTADLTSEPVLRVPREVADQLPKSGLARVIVLTQDENTRWHVASGTLLNRAYGEDEPEYSLADIKP